MSKIYSLNVSEIKTLVDACNLVYLVGDFGASVQITGDIDRSNVVRGTYAVETEIGTVYLDDQLLHTVKY